MSMLLVALGIGGYVLAFVAYLHGLVRADEVEAEAYREGFNQGFNSVGAQISPWDDRPVTIASLQEYMEEERRR